jgi:hypothetical protein
MEFDLEDLKNKYRKRPRADIVDLDRMQVMIPFLVREVCRLESELAEAKEYISSLEKKKPGDTKNGKLGNAEWDVAYDLKKNRLIIKMKGVFDFKSAKMSSNAIVNILDNVKTNFDLIQDIRELEALKDMKSLFHLRKLRYLFVQAGINRSVRIDNEKETVVSAVFKKHFQEGLKAITVKTMEDAVIALENDGRFLSQ